MGTVWGWDLVGRRRVKEEGEEEVNMIEVL
jgi:hypothetical protein